MKEELLKKINNAETLQLDKDETNVLKIVINDLIKQNSNYETTLNDIVYDISYYGNVMISKIFGK